MFEAQDKARVAHYKLTSTVILSLGSETDALGSMDLSGNMVRQVEQDMPVEDDNGHVVNIGRLVEDMELKMRNLLRAYIGHISQLAKFKLTSMQKRFTLARRRTWLVTFEVYSH